MFCHAHGAAAHSALHSRSVSRSALLSPPPGWRSVYKVLRRTGASLLNVEELRHRLRALSDDAFLFRVTGATARLYFISPAAEALLGVPVSELQDHGLFDSGPRRDRPAYLTALAAAALGKDAQSVEFRLRREDRASDSAPDAISRLKLFEFDGLGVLAKCSRRERGEIGRAISDVDPIEQTMVLQLRHRHAKQGFRGRRNKLHGAVAPVSEMTSRMWRAAGDNGLPRR